MRTHWKPKANTLMPTDSPTVQRRFSVREIADTLDVTTRTIRNHIKAGDLPAQKVGRRYVITYSDLVQYLGTETRVNEVFGINPNA